MELLERTARDYAAKRLKINGKPSDGDQLGLTAISEEFMAGAHYQAQLEDKLKPHNKKPIVVSGGVGSGKSYLVEAFSQLFVPARVLRINLNQEELRINQNLMVYSMIILTEATSDITIKETWQALQKLFSGYASAPAVIFETQVTKIKLPASEYYIIYK